MNTLIISNDNEAGSKLSKIAKKVNKPKRNHRLCKLKSDKHDQTKTLISEYLACHPLAKEGIPRLPVYRFDEVMAYTLIDPEQFEIFKDVRLTFLTSGKKPYARVWVGKRYELLSRLLTGAPVGMVVDHINGDTLDNRLFNLRVCTQEENLQNQGLRGEYRPRVRKRSA